jgi:hypothetical protein
VYGFTNHDPAGLRNTVMTFDKFSKMSIYDLNAHFDLIVIDECHLMQMSAYRGLVPAESIDRARSTHTPLVMMTGTPIAEPQFVKFNTILHVKRERLTDKLFNLVVCNSPQDRMAQACIHIANAIRSGRRVIMPTNQGQSYIEKVSSAVQHILDRPVYYQYYKKEHSDSSFMFDINQQSTIGDIEILFCSTYLSVGVDINDMSAFDIVYTEDFTAHEIEQFNNRLRRVDLASYYFVNKYAGDGKFRANLVSSLLPNLRVSKIKTLALKDLIALHTIESDEHGQITKLFDFFQRHMNMPYLIKKPNGDVTLHPTVYALYTFEEAWRKWSIQVPVLVDQLRNYNYAIAVINADLLDDANLDEVLGAARHGYQLYQNHVADDIAYAYEQLAIFDN